MNNINSNFSFELFDQRKVFKDIKKLGENKASPKKCINQNNEEKYRYHVLHFIS